MVESTVAGGRPGDETTLAATVFLGHRKRARRRVRARRAFVSDEQILPLTASVLLVSSVALHHQTFDDGAVYLWAPSTASRKGPVCAPLRHTSPFPQYMPPRSVPRYSLDAFSGDKPPPLSKTALRRGRLFRFLPLLPRYSVHPFIRRNHDLRLASGFIAQAVGFQLRSPPLQVLISLE